MTFDQLRYRAVRKLLGLPTVVIHISGLTEREQQILSHQLSKADHIQISSMMHEDVDVLVRSNNRDGVRPLFVDANKLSETYLTANRLGIPTISLSGFVAALQDTGMAPDPGSGNGAPRKKARSGQLDVDSGHIPKTGGLCAAQRHISHSAAGDEHMDAQMADDHPSLDEWQPRRRHHGRNPRIVGDSPSDGDEAPSEVIKVKAEAAEEARAKALTDEEQRQELMRLFPPGWLEQFGGDRAANPVDLDAYMVPASAASNGWLPPFGEMGDEILKARVQTTLSSMPWPSRIQIWMWARTDQSGGHIFQRTHLEHLGQNQWRIGQFDISIDHLLVLACGHAMAPVIDCTACDEGVGHTLWTLDSSSYLETYQFPSHQGNYEAATLDEIGLSSWNQLSDGDEILLNVKEGDHNRFFVARLSWAGLQQMPVLEYETSATALQGSFKTIDLNDVVVQVILSTPQLS